MVGNSLSYWSIVRSGIHKGSVLGPTMFLVTLLIFPPNLFSVAHRQTATRGGHGGHVPPVKNCAPIERGTNKNLIG